MRPARRLLAVTTVTLLLAVAAAGCVAPEPNQPPHAGARTDPEGGGVVGQEIQFIGGGHDPDGSIVGYQWDFGDGSDPFVNATRPSTVHTYERPGLFQAVFKACDDAGDCGEATVNLTIETGLAITVNWTGFNGYVVSGSPSLDAALIRVTLQPEGAGPTEFALGSGLEELGGGRYGAALPGSTLEREHSTTVTVRYNGTQVASRTALAHPFAGSSRYAGLAYRVEESEVAPFGIYNVSTQSVGNETWLVAGGAIGHTFLGTGSSTVSQAYGGSNQTTTQDATTLAWNETWGRYAPTITPIDRHASGTGTVEQWDVSGVHGVINLTAFETIINAGNTTRFSAAGAGTFEGGLPGTFGAITYDAHSTGTETAPTGDGENVRSLRVLVNTTYNGTLGGANYTSTNRSTVLSAAGEAYYPSDFWVAWNETGMVGTQPLASSGVEYLDTDHDGNYNPDLRPPFPSDGRVFAGLVPSTLALGDQVQVQNGLGHQVVLTVKTLAQTILVADGFTSAAVTTALLAGSYGDPGQPAAPAGSLSYTVVAQGEHALLWLNGGEHLTLSGRTFDRAITLKGTA